MNPAELLLLCADRDICLTIGVDGLELDYPLGALDAELLESIREAKVELLGLLAEASKPPPATGKRPGPASWRLENDLSTLGPEGLDLTGEDKDLARLARRDDDGRPRISKF